MVLVLGLVAGKQSCTVIEPDFIVPLNLLAQ